MKKIFISGLTAFTITMNAQTVLSNINQASTSMLDSKSKIANTCVDSLIADYDAAIGYNDAASTSNNNYGSAAQFAGYAVPANPGLNVNRGLIHFNLTGIPSNATITHAEMDLFAYGTLGSYPGHYGSNNNSLIQRVTGSWAEYTATWNNQPTSTATNQVALAGTSNPTLDYLNIDVTSIIQDIMSSQSNNGMILKLANEASTNILVFCSKDHSNASKHPKLRVSYVCNATSIASLESGIRKVSCFPNPAKSVLHFSVSSTKSGSAKLIIYDFLGKQIKEETIAIDHTLTETDYLLNVSSLNSGIYSYSLMFEKEYTTGKFIIE